MTGLMTSMVRLFGYLMLLIAVVTAFVTARLMDDAKESLKAATFAMETGKRDLAAAHLEDAAKSYVPGSPYPRQALRELAIMARAAEMRGEMARALSLWESIRRSVIATRHLIQPNADVLSDAEADIVRLRNDPEPVDPAVKLIARPVDPSPVLSVLIFLGLLAWIAGTAAFCLSPRNPDGSPQIKRAVSAGTSLIGLAVWIVSAWLV